MIIIIVYRISVASNQGVYTLLIQNNRRRAEVLTTETHYKEVFDNIKDCVK